MIGLSIAETPIPLISIPIILSDGQVANLQVTKSIQTVMEDLSTLRLVLLVVTTICHDSHVDIKSTIKQFYYNAYNFLN